MCLTKAMYHCNAREAASVELLRKGQKHAVLCSMLHAHTICCKCHSRSHVHLVHTTSLDWGHSALAHHLSTSEHDNNFYYRKIAFACLHQRAAQSRPRTQPLCKSRTLNRFRVQGLIHKHHLNRPARPLDQDASGGSSSPSAGAIVARVSWAALGLAAPPTTSRAGGAV